MGGNPEWPEDLTQRLLDLWAGTLSAAAIGRALGMSKNSVLGKVRRLHLPSRPSPIAYTSGAMSARKRRADAGPRLPGTGRLIGPTLPDPVNGAAAVTAARRRSKAAEVVVAAAPAPTPPTPSPERPAQTCQWITREHPRPALFCDKAVTWRNEIPTAWCADHFARVYTRRTTVAAI